MDLLEQVSLRQSGCAYNKRSVLFVVKVLGLLPMDEMLPGMRGDALRVKISISMDYL